MWVFVAILHVQLLTCAVLGLHEGTAMVGVDCDGSLMTRTHGHGDWREADDSCCVKAVAILPDEDQTLLGLGLDGCLYTKRSPRVGSGWDGPIEGTCADLQDVIVMPDDRIVGVTPAKKMVVRDDLTTDSEWEHVEGSYSCVAIAAYPDGRILGVTSEGVLKERPGVQGEWSWDRISGASNMDAIALSIQPDGTVFGIGSEDNGLHVLQEDLKWGPMLDNSYCVKNAVSPQNLGGNY